MKEKIKRLILSKKRTLSSIRELIDYTPILSQKKLSKLYMLENEVKAQIKVLQYLIKKPQ